MRTPTHDLELFLGNLEREARPGDRVPTIRDLMRRFGVSQVVVQRALQGLRARGHIASEVGRGTFFVSAGREAAETTQSVANHVAEPRDGSPKSVLLLRRSASIARGRLLIEGLQRRFSEDGHHVLEVAYNDPNHARTVLRALPRFHACVIQSSFKPIAVDLLVALKEKTDVVAVDGAALIGTEVDAVGAEWGEPLDAAIALLRQRGHRSIAFAVTSVPFLAVEFAKRRFETLQRMQSDVRLYLITLPNLPYESYEEALAEAMAERNGTSGRQAFTALVAWGIEDGAKFRSLLSDRGMPIPSALSVVLLGRTDCANEHADFFETIGCAVADQVDFLHQVINARWSDPMRPYELRFIPMVQREGASVQGPPLAKSGRR